MARILGVRTGKFSIAPQTMADGRLRLGFVEAASTDFLRDGLIGIAPLLVGGAFVVYIGMNYLGLEVIWEGVLRSEFVMIWKIVPKLYSQTDFWLWFYFAFTISSTMFPSVSDRRAWLPLGLILIGFIMLLFFIDSQVSSIAVLENLSRYLNHAINTANSVLVISLFIHFLVFPFVWFFRNALIQLSRPGLGL
ncbi:MAG: hypothetical protein IBX69_14040 [Anaerolineales bacterium]|nr:hypothetical protein [Anaerolineales bacterium]